MRATFNYRFVYLRCLRCRTRWSYGVVFNPGSFDMPETCQCGGFLVSEDAPLMVVMHDDPPPP